MARLVVSSPPQVIENVDGKTIAEALRENGLNPVEFVALVDGRPVPMDSVLEGDDEVRLVRVVSGG